MIEDGLYNRLSNYAALTAIVSTRIYASYLPQTLTLPAVAYSKQGSAPRMLLASDTDVFDTKFDITCLAKTYAQANDVAAQIVAALQRYKGTNAGVVIEDIAIKDISNDYEQNLEIYDVSINITITHRGI